MKLLKSCMQNKQKLHFKKQMHVLYDFKSRYFSAPGSWIRSNGFKPEKGKAKIAANKINFTCQT